jgi:hypothetical protein
MDRQKQSKNEELNYIFFLFLNFNELFGNQKPVVLGFQLGIGYFQGNKALATLYKGASPLSFSGNNIISNKR